eukprot:gene10360-21614_t
MGEEFTTTDYWTRFTQSITEIRVDIELLSKRNVEFGGELISNIKFKISSLQKYTNDCSSVLPAYDIRRSQEELEAVNKELISVSSQVQPKKKFSFASRSKSKTKQTETETEKKVVTSSDDHSHKDSSSSSTTTACSDGGVASSSGVLDIPGSHCIIDKNNECLEVSIDTGTGMEDGKGEGEDVAVGVAMAVQLLVRSCSHCTISAKGVLGSVRLENLAHCQVYLGPCSTSVYLESCTSCVVFLASHQLRIHKSVDCELYVRCQSHPIVEDCTGLLLAPYSARYNDVDNDFKLAGLEGAVCWDNVVDFRWHRSTQSPNWSCTPIDQRKSSIPVSGWEVTASGEG